MKRYRYGLYAGAVLLLAGILIQLLWPGIDSIVTTPFVAVGSALLVASGLRMATRYRGVAITDERLRKANVYAASYSWLFTALFINVLIWLFHFELVHGTTEQTMSWVATVMILSLFLFRWYLGRKADIE